MTNENRRDGRTITFLDEIPDFATEAEERAFWATHRLSQDVYEQMPGTVDDDEPGIPLSDPPPHHAEHGRVRLDLE